MTYFQWPPMEVVTLRSKLDELAEAVRDSQRKGDERVAALLARFLVVRSCGFVEQSLVCTLRGYVSSKSGGYVRSFAQSWLMRSRNPSPQAIEGMLGRFDSLLASEFASFIDDDSQARRRDLEFMVDRRNKIAHGLNEGITERRALDLKETSVAVTDWFILRLNPER